jgi:hypothetical protein
VWAGGVGKGGKRDMKLKGKAKQTEQRTHQEKRGNKQDDNLWTHKVKRLRSKTRMEINRTYLGTIDRYISTQHVFSMPQKRTQKRNWRLRANRGITRIILFPINFGELTT